MLLNISDDLHATWYDLLNGTVKATSAGYYEGINGDGMLERRYGLVGKSSGTVTNLDVIEAFKELEDWARKAAEWKAQPARNMSVWLEEAADEEVTYKRALVDSISVNRFSVSGISPLLNLNALLGEIVIITMPFNESRVARNSTNSTISIRGGTLDIPGGGTANGRMAIISPYNPASRSVSKVWAGIRPTYYGTSDFDPVMIFNTGTNGTDATDTADTEAGDGTAVKITFATDETDVLRSTLAISDTVTSGDYNHFSGSYHALLRYRIDSGGSPVIGLTMKTGYISATQNQPNPKAYLSHQSIYYTLHDMGIVDIPGHAYRRIMSSSANIENFKFYIYAELISGTATTNSLWIDNIILVPADYYMIGEGAGNGQYIKGYVFENNESAVFANTTTTDDIQGVASGNNGLSVPPEGGIMVLAAELGGLYNEKGKNFASVDYTIYDRYGRYAGNG